MDFGYPTVLACTVRYPCCSEQFVFQVVTSNVRACGAWTNKMFISAHSVTLFGVHQFACLSKIWSCYMPRFLQEFALLTMHSFFHGA